MQNNDPPFDMDAVPVTLQAGLAHHWQRFIESADSDVIASAGSREELPRVWCASEFVAGWCIRQSEYFAELLESGDLERDYAAGETSRMLDAVLAGVNDETGLDKALRRHRQRQMVRIAWRDLAGFSSLEQTMQEVSALADASIAAALLHHHRWLQHRYGVPRDEAGNAVGLVVMGLGKLGGNELNYSSDVDLIYAYEGAGETDGDKSIDNQEYFVRLGRKIVGSLDRIDVDGFVFRTDLRLRPNGDSGPVALSFSAMEHYYQTHGRNWERYALIKARVVAGDPLSGQRLLDMLRPFVYRKYLDFSAFDAIREMKTQIEHQLRKSGNQGDIKLGRGGIREIEFLVQNHQLIRGGRETGLQTSSLYRALAEMQQLGIVDAATSDQLLAAYRFLRNVEHRLQMVADRQTQKLPQQPLECSRLAFSMGYADWNGFLAALDRHREWVHRLFTGLLETETESALSQNASDDELAARLTALWHGQLDDDAASELLDEVGFKDAGHLPGMLTQFRSGNLYRAYVSVERDRLDRLMPLALQAAGSHANAERAISAFVAVVEAIGRRSVYLSLLIENPIALRQLLHLCAASSWISRHIGQHPVVLDELLQPMQQGAFASADQLRAELQHRLEQVDPTDEEMAMTVLRELQQAQVLRIAAADVRGELEGIQVEQALTLLAEVLLQQVLVEAVQKVEKKQGPAPGQIAVIGYGKFASRELGYHSDLDVVVFYAPDNKTPATEAEYFFSRAGQRLVHLLTARTHAGPLYELDMRLRPSGRSGTLVSTLKSFSDYQHNNAWTWEHQALVRARLVAGDSDMGDQFEQIRREILCLERDPEKLRADIIDMRRRMVEANSQGDKDNFDLKLDFGGIVDIEFALQYLVLRHARQFPALTEPRTTADLIIALAKQGLMEASQATALAGIYRGYLRSSLDLKLLDRPLLVPAEQLAAERAQVRALWDDTFG